MCITVKIHLPSTREQQRMMTEISLAMERPKRRVWSTCSQFFLRSRTTSNSRMLQMKNILPIVLIAVGLSACEKTVYLDLAQNDSKIIIEGQVTNHAGYQYVKISRSVGFYETGESPRVQDAIVIVSDDSGNEFEFVHNPRGH